MDKALEEQVRSRARGRCEYCLMPRGVSRLRFAIDHIRARQHGGLTESTNLALSCARCNGSKGPNLSGVDPETGRMTRLFNPRRDRWLEHFCYKGAVIQGLTGIGPATIEVLDMNHPSHVSVRETLIDLGEFQTL